MADLGLDVAAINYGESMVFIARKGYPEEAELVKKPYKQGPVYLNTTITLESQAGKDNIPLEGWQHLGDPSPPLMEGKIWAPLLKGPTDVF